MKAPLSYVPALPAVIGIVGGIIADSLGFGVAAAVAGAIAFIILYNRRLHYSGLCALMLAAGAILAIAHHRAAAPDAIFEGKHTFVASVETASENLTTVSYEAKVSEVDGRKCRPFLVLVSVQSMNDEVGTGAIIRFKARLQRVEHTEEVPHEEDYSRILALRGITARCMLNAPVYELSPPSGLQALANRARDHIFNAIVDSPVSGSTAAFLVAAILGDRRFISSEELSAFRDTGVAHVLALSGLHVGIIASMLALMLYPLRLWRRGMSVAAIVTMVAVWAYAVVVGLSPSILRAAVMISVVLVARLIGRGSNGFNSLSVAVVVILAADPMSLFTPGFQLSVAAVGAILMFGGLVPKRLRHHPLLYSAAGMLITSVAAMAGTGIVSAYYFNTFPLLFLAGNVITGLFFPLILGGGIVLAALTAMGMSFGLLGETIDALHSLMQRSIDWLAAFDGSVVSVPWFPEWVILPYAAAVVLLAFALHRRTRLLWTLTGAMTLATCICAYAAREHIQATELYIPSSFSPASVIMRAGDKAWLYTPGEKNGGSALERANKRYRRYLLSRGCGESFIPVSDSLRTPSFQVHDMLISAPGQTIAIVGRRMPDLSDSHLHIDCALVCSDFTGSIDDIRAALHPDTILLSRDIHPSRRASLLRTLLR